MNHSGMNHSGMNPKVDEFLRTAKHWQEEYAKLRNIALDCGLTEEFKWVHPCYTFEGKNVVLLHGFKEYCALLFFKGALLQDAQGILIKQTENVQAARQIRFTSLQDIVAVENVLKVYINDAIQIEKYAVPIHKTSEFTIPDELHNKFDNTPAMKSAFEKLTPGRQRAYLLYFSQPKQSKTRESRIEKCMKQILNGKGLND